MRGPAPTAAAHPCYPCPGGDGEVLLGHVVSLPSESGTAGRHYAQPCSECPILPREPGATEHPDPGDRGAAGGGREADLWVSFPPSSTSSVSGAPYPQKSSELAALLVVQPCTKHKGCCPQSGLESAGSAHWAASTCKGAGGGRVPGSRAGGPQVGFSGELHLN